MKKSESKKNLMGGMKRMSTDPFLSGEELCRLIDTCAKKGVVELKYGPLHVSFGLKQAKATPGPTIPAPSPQYIQVEQDKAHAEAIEHEEIVTREEQIAELLITDPLGAEEMLVRGQLEPEDKVEDGSD